MVTLEACKTFRLLSEAELSALRQIASERSFAGGQVIFREGDSGDGVYVVKDGLVEISANVAEATSKVFAQITPNEMFGEMAVLELKPRSATATAVKDCIVYFIPRDELLSLVEHSPLLALELLREISQRLRDFNHRYLLEILQTERLTVVGRFARSIVHDIKNPLNIIGLMSELIGMEQSTAEVRKKAAKTIQKQVERISEMTGEIMDFIQGSRSQAILATLDYGTFVQRLLEEIQPELELKGTRLNPEGFPTARTPLDPQRMRRAFFNLLHNANDAMADGGIIFIRFTTTKTEVITEIEDTGPGIAPEIADKLFEAFATYGKAHGTGLGLSICKKIVEDHQGRIWTRKEPDRGAIFCFALPLAP